MPFERRGAVSLRPLTLRPGRSKSASLRHTVSCGQPARETLLNLPESG